LFLFTKLLLDKVDGAIYFFMATKRCMLVAFQDKSFIDVLIEILVCLLAVMSRQVTLSYSMTISMYLMMTQLSPKSYFSNLAL